MIHSDLFRQGMRRLASGVSLITTLAEGQPHGLIATAVSSVTAAPPTLLICVNRSASSHGPITRSGIFCVNLLSGDDGDVTETFTQEELRVQRFAGERWQPLTTGAPALQGALASFDCRVLQEVQASSHTIFIGAVEAVEIWTAHCAPLIYVGGGYLRPGSIT